MTLQGQIFHNADQSIALVRPSAPVSARQVGASKLPSARLFVRHSCLVQM